MKSYEEITQKLLERRENYLVDKKRKKKKMMAVIVPVCCITIVSSLVFGVWYRNDIKNSLQFSDSEQKQEESIFDNADNNDENSIKNDKKEDLADKKKPNKNSHNKGKNDKTTADATDSNQVTESVLELPDKHHGHNNNKDHNEDLTHIVTDDPNADKCIQKIVVTQMPIKTVYYPGDTFDFRGLEVTGYFSTGEVEDITPYVQIYNTIAYGVDDNYSIYIEYTDNSYSINLAFTEFYFKVIEPSLDINKTKVTLNIGESTDNDVVTGAKNCVVTWHSTDTSVATVDNDGNITAVGSGSASVYAVISYDYPSGNCAFMKESPRCTVTVNDVAY